MIKPPTTNTAHLDQDLTLSCLDRFGQPIDVSTTFGYSVEDPYAVSITFRVGSHSIRWVLARTLLMRGLSEPAGEGDVHLYPSIDEDGRAVLVLDFHSPDGRLVAQSESHKVYEFLMRSFTLVPAGTESTLMDLDALVADLTGAPRA